MFDLLPVSVFTGMTLAVGEYHVRLVFALDSRVAHCVIEELLLQGVVLDLEAGSSHPRGGGEDVAVGVKRCGTAARSRAGDGSSD